MENPARVAGILAGFRKRSTERLDPSAVAVEDKRANRAGVLDSVSVRSVCAMALRAF